LTSYLSDLHDLDRSQVALAGAKGANLGELSRIEGITVPPGFCVTTQAFRMVIAEDPSIADRIDALSHLDADDRDGIASLSTELRRALEALVIPDDLATAIADVLAELGEPAPYAVRSSATAEDSPVSSFAGLHDTFLNLVGPDAVLRHIPRCWASLFTERAVTYRLRNALDQDKAQMAVVVQRMVAADAAGVLFTADPLTANRNVASVEAGFGLGEDLVSGMVTPDVFEVRDGEIVTRKMAVDGPALTDERVLRLVGLGRRIERHFGRPQDIEWCLVGDEFHFVQSRPITTLFPIPHRDDDENHVYVSVGHGQMMTDAMRPLGLSFWRLTTPRPMFEAGGRLWVDVTEGLASPAGRGGLLDVLGRGDPLIRDALETIVDRGDFLPTRPDEAPADHAVALTSLEPVEADPAIITDLIQRNQESVEKLAVDIRARAGPDLFDFILAELDELRRLLMDPLSTRVLMTAMQATWWLNEHMEEWLGETNAADILTQSAPNNVTSEMGLALLNVADVIRPHPEVVALLEQVGDEDFLDGLTRLDGGQEAANAIGAYLDEYGMRCVGEIDITRPRWSERPGALVPLILSNVRAFGPGEAERRFEQGRREALAMEEELLERLRALPDGDEKAEETRRMVERIRTFIGYREYPKYGMVTRYFLYKQALMAEADRLMQAGVIRDREDVFFLTFPEFHNVVRTGHADTDLIDRRKNEFRMFQAMTPPRVLTSEGEALSGAYRRDGLPAGALIGLAVSAGTVEGRARVILDMAEADPEPGDILVTAHTDPSWSPLFVAVSGLVTEVGGLMTHGAVIAREYGLPAVVGVDQATRLIQDGDRIRVDGTNGYVEILG
jgi:pyruvate,water dikinase